jgi:hypothetical protein
MRILTFVKIITITVLNMVMSASLFASPSNQATVKEPTMKFNNYAYIFLGPGLDPVKDRKQITAPNFTFTVVGIDFNDKEKVVGVAKELIAEGAQMIELCGGFGPVWIAKVMEATHNQVPIGGVFYGPEARKPLVDLLTIDSGQSAK